MAANLSLVSPRWASNKAAEKYSFPCTRPAASSSSIYSSYGRGRLDSHCAAKNGVSPRSQRLLSSFWAYSDCFRHIRDPNADTAALEGKYVELTTIHGRDFQTFSIENTIHLVPVDEVRIRDEGSQLTPEPRLRKRSTDWKLNTRFLTLCSTESFSSHQYQGSAMSWTAVMALVRGRWKWRREIQTVLQVSRLPL